MSPAERTLRGRIRLWTMLFMAGLVLAGATAIPLPREVDWLGRAFLGPDPAPGVSADGGGWLFRVHTALHDTDAQYPFLFYGTDWLAFGHFAIAIAFAGALRDPVRNKWLFKFGMIVCALVVPYALFFGAIRGLPLWWRLIDCSFGVFGFVPLWLCARWTSELEITAARLSVAGCSTRLAA